MTTPEIAIGIPFRDPGPYFASALRSVFAQTLSTWELLLLDDGSQDGSTAFARGLNDPRVRLISDGVRRGLAVRLNQLSHEAQAPFLARMDADDIMHPQRLQVQLAALRQCRGSTVIGSCAYALDQFDHVVGFKPSVPPAHYHTEHTFIHPTIAAPTAWFRAHPYSEESVFARCEDAELWTRCLGDTRYEILPQALLYYREVGTFSLENYLATQRGLREIIRRRYPHPWLRAHLRLAHLHMKGLGARWYAALGATDHLVRRRFLALTPSELIAAQSALKQVQLTVIGAASP